MAITAKAKSSVYHLTTALSNLEKAKVHLLQAETALPKQDHHGRALVSGAQNALLSFATTTINAIKEITAQNTTEDNEAEVNA